MFRTCRIPVIQVIIWMNLVDLANLVDLMDVVNLINLYIPVTWVNLMDMGILMILVTCD